MSTTHHYRTQLACALHGYRALIVPSLGAEQGQGWLSLWAQQIPRSSKIRLLDWECAHWLKWHNSIIAALISIDEPVVVVAEGFGALAAASVAAEYPSKIIALFLVDPADPEQFNLSKKLPKKALSMTSQVVVRGHQNTDTLVLSASLAAHLGADFLALENAADTQAPAERSAENYWPEGIAALALAVNKVERKAEELTQARTKKVLAYLRALQQAHALKQLGQQPC
jgi:uncharacterized protein